MSTYCQVVVVRREKSVGEHRHAPPPRQPAYNAAHYVKRPDPPREAALEAASTHGDFGPFLKLLNILAHPYEDQPGCGEFESPPAPDERVLRTFCGT